MKYPIVFSVILLLLLGFKEPVSNSKISVAHIPQINEVGVQVMPKEIKPVNAPFSTIKFKRPVFPPDTIILSLSKEGINTKAIQQAIDALSPKGGGYILIPAGEWLTGRIQLKDNINLYFADSAILKFSGEIKDYLPAVFTRYAGVELMSLGACIYANGATNIAITGNGLLIGPGESPVRDQMQGNELFNEIDSDTPVSERIYDGIAKPIVFRPMFISPINCRKVFIEGITLEKTAFWNIVPVYCDNVIIRGVTINSVDIPSGDGIDIESSKNVLIEYCTLSNGDDSFTMKAGRGADGIRVNKPTENVVVRYCLTLTGHGGITCGSETAGIIRNLYVHDCVFKKVLFAIRFKTRRSRGGGGENLVFERIRLNAVKEAFAWDMLGLSMFVGELAERLPVREVNELTPYYKNIFIKDIIIENASNFIKVRGIPESPLDNVIIENVNAKCKSFMNIHDMSNAVFKNININCEDSIITFIDSKNIQLENVNSKNPLLLDIHGALSDSIFVKSSFNINDTIYISALIEIERL